MNAANNFKDLRRPLISLLIFCFVERPVGTTSSLNFKFRNLIGKNHCGPTWFFFHIINFQL